MTFLVADTNGLEKRRNFNCLYSRKTKVLELPKLRSAHKKRSASSYPTPHAFSEKAQMAFGFRTKKKLEASRSKSPDVKKDKALRRSKSPDVKKDKALRRSKSPDIKKDNSRRSKTLRSKSPDIKKDNSRRTNSPSSVVKDYDYGYGDARPDSEKNAYGDSANSNNETRPARTPRRSSKKGGGTTEDYGYGEACPDSDSRPAPPVRSTPRRSSMKQGNSGGMRRSSIGFTGEMAVTLPGKTKPVRRRTSIAFAEEAEIRVVKPIATLTDEPDTLWFQDDELSKIKDRLRAVVSTVESGDINSRVCIRGLEGHIGGSTRIKVRAAWDAVKGEQTMQKMEGEFNEGGISSMYKLFTKESANQAAERAQQDAADIDKYQRDTRRMMRRLSC